MHYGISAVHSIWMALAWVVAAGLLCACIFLLFSAIFGRGTTSPDEILRRRYAAGEIDTEEYERRRSELRKTKPAA
jgi:uncharacterized membrane protein